MLLKLSLFYKDNTDFFTLLKINVYWNDFQCVVHSSIIYINNHVIFKSENCVIITKNHVMVHLSTCYNFVMWKVAHVSKRRIT